MGVVSTAAGARPIVVIGDVGMDVVAVPSGPIRYGTDTPAQVSMRRAGAGANTAAWLGTAGADVTLVARVGDDSAGRTARAELERAGVRCVWAVDRDLPTGLVVVLVDASGERTMLPLARRQRGLALHRRHRCPRRRGRLPRGYAAPAPLGVRPARSGLTRGGPRSARRGAAAWVEHISRPAGRSLGERGGCGGVPRLGPRCRPAAAQRQRGRRPRRRADDPGQRARRRGDRRRSGGRAGSGQAARSGRSRPSP
jgi:hypothetical protein